MSLRAVFACTIVTPCSLSLYQCHSVSAFACTSVTPYQSSPVPLLLRISLRMYQCHSVQSSPVPLSLLAVLACTSVTPCSLRLYQCHSVSVFACTIVTAYQSLPVPLSLGVSLRLYQCHSSFRSLYTVIPFDTRIFYLAFHEFDFRDFYAF